MITIFIIIMIGLRSTFYCHHFFKLNQAFILAGCGEEFCVSADSFSYDKHFYKVFIKNQYFLMIRLQPRTGFQVN